MLLIDGVKYELWTPPSEDEFKQVVKEHTEEIFGGQSIYLDRKQKLKSLSGIGSIPDGYVIVFRDSPEWHIVEVELSSHPLHEHIVSQVSKFISGVSNPNIQKGIVNAIDEEIIRDDFLKLKLKKAIEPTEIHRFLTDLISKPPILTIIIEKDTQELKEAISSLAHPEIKVVEFQTFIREGIGLPVHAHLFKPVYALVPPVPPPPPSPRKVKAGDFTHKGSGIFVLKSDPSVAIDVNKRIRLVGEQLAKHALETKRLSSFYWLLRRKANLLHKPTEG